MTVCVKISMKNIIVFMQMIEICRHKKRWKFDVMM